MDRMLIERVRRVVHAKQGERYKEEHGNFGRN